MIQIGDKTKFAFEIREKLDGPFQNVDIWANSVLLTSNDNTVYLPQFIHSLKVELENISSASLKPEDAFLNFDPTTDDVVARADNNQGVSLLKIEVVDSNQVLSLTLKTSVLISYYQKCIDVLTCNAT